MTRNKRIIWTVEWVHRNGSRELGRCPDTEPLGVAYTKLVDAKAAKNIEKAGSTTKPPKKKHKSNKATSKSEVVTPITPPRDLSAGHPKPPSALDPSELPTESTEGVPASLIACQDIATTPADPENRMPLLPSPTPEQPSVTQVYFYLLLPSTPTSYRVVIPLVSSDSLASALTDRLVLEFPTIYALKQPPDKLPKGFMNEEDYLRAITEKGHLDKHLDGLLGEARGWERDDLDGEGKQGFDPKAVQDVLKRDLISVVDTT
ncbi:MAG: hypothetical protein Q9169_001193 [Polycauliona sp. 2 TL-2023]